MIAKLQQLWQQRKNERRVQSVLDSMRIRTATRKVFVIGSRSQAEAVCPWATTYIRTDGGFWCLSFKQPEPFIYCEGRR